MVQTFSAYRLLCIVSRVNSNVSDHQAQGTSYTLSQGIVGGYTSCFMSFIGCLCRKRCRCAAFLDYDKASPRDIEKRFARENHAMCHKSRRMYNEPGPSSHSTAAHYQYDRFCTPCLFRGDWCATALKLQLCALLWSAHWRPCRKR